MTDRIIDDPAALRDYLVRLAMEAIASATEENRREGVLTEQLQRHLRERMAQAATTIVCEVEDARAEAARAAEAP